MMRTGLLIYLIILPGFFSCAQTLDQNRTRANDNIGGACEGCEAINESPVPFEQLTATDTLPDFSMEGPKLTLCGQVLTRDGKPAKDVILYIYHTDQTGIYPTKGNEQGWGRRHGFIRGWVKTNEHGHYSFYTLKPAPYPGGNAPAHIHITIKEPGKKEYWIDDVLFEGDSLLTSEERSRQEWRGGSGIVRLQASDGLLVATRNIILGKNIPNYH